MQVKEAIIRLINKINFIRETAKAIWHFFRQKRNTVTASIQIKHTPEKAFYCQSLQSRDALMNLNTEGLQEGAEPLVKSKKKRVILVFSRKHLKKTDYLDG